MKTVIVATLICTLAFVAGGNVFGQGAGEEVEKIKEMLIKVQPNIIQMTKGIDETQIEYARVRSTELRDLNKKYNAVKIERVIEVEEEWVDGELVEVETELPDTYILKFEDYRDEEGKYISINLDEAIGEYSKLPVVVSAEKRG